MTTYPAARAAVSNGTRRFPPEVDARGSSARRLRDLLADFEHAFDRINPLPTVAQQQMLKRCASLSLLAEGLESRLAAGHALDPDGLVRVSSTLARIIGKLGLPITPKADRPATLEQLFGEETPPVSAYGHTAAQDPDVDDDDVRDFQPEPALSGDDYRANLSAKAKRKIKRKRSIKRVRVRP